MLLIGSVAGQENLYTWSLDETKATKPVAKQLTTTAGSKSDAQFTADGKDVFYLEDGKIQSVSLEKKEPKPLAVTAEMDVDFATEKGGVFKQAWGRAEQRILRFDLSRDQLAGHSHRIRTFSRWQPHPPTNCAGC